MVQTEEIIKKAEKVKNNQKHILDEYYEEHINYEEININNIARFIQH